MDSIIKSSIKEPFDPSSLKAEVKNSTIGALVDMLKNNLIDLNPEFQRSGNLWNDKRKSQLIESILLGLPLPSFYFYVDERLKKWVVIDGLQRLCSLQSFMVDEALCLHGLEFLNESVYGKSFKDFDYFDQLAMKMHPVTLNVLSGDTSAEARYIIFQRVNAKGTQLSPAEMRNALYQGAATTLIKRMSENIHFKKLVSDQISTTRMKDREFASRFLLFYLTDYKDYNGYLDMSINRTLDYINKFCDDKLLEGIYQDFERSLSLCEKLLGINAFRRPENRSKNKRRNVVSFTIFEILTVSLARLNEIDIQKLLSHTDRFRNNYELLFQDNTMQSFLAEGTSKKTAVTYRFEKIQQVIIKTINSL